MVSLLRPTPIMLRARPIMIFGIGNHTYPNSRNSVGHYMVDMLARRLGVVFYHNKQCTSYLGHYPEEDLLLVKPDTFLVSDNKEALRRIVLRWNNIEPSKSIFIYHETQLPIGDVRFATSGRTNHNQALAHLAEDLKTDEFPRIAVGIEHPTPNVRFEAPPLHILRAPDCGMDELYLLNKFPDEHWLRLHEFSIPKVFGAIDAAIGRIRRDWPLSTEEAGKLTPNVFTEEESNIPPPPQLSRKQQRALQRKQDKNKEVVQPLPRGAYEMNDRILYS